MLKNILKLKGAKKLTRNEQKHINGGGGKCGLGGGCCDSTAPDCNCAGLPLCEPY